MIRSFEEPSPSERLIIDNFKAAFESARIGRSTGLEGLNQFVKLHLGGKLKVRTIAITPRLWLLMAGILFLLGFIAYAAANELTTFLASSFLMFCGFLGYMLLHLILYLHAFPQWEAINMASFGRYAGIYILGWLWFTFAQFLYQTESEGKLAKSAKGVGAASCLLMLLIMAPYARCIVTQEIKPGPVYWARNEIRHKLAPLYWHNKNDPIRKIYFVYQGSDGIHLMIARFEMFPHRVNRNCENLSLDPNTTSPFECYRSPGEWAKIIDKFDYVVIAQANESLWSGYSAVFPMVDRGNDRWIFKVEKGMQLTRNQESLLKQIQ